MVGHHDRMGLRDDEPSKSWNTSHPSRGPNSQPGAGNSVSLVARRHGIAGNQLFSWRRLMAQGALTAAGAGEEVVPASELRSAHQQIWGKVARRGMHRHAPSTPM
jgi:transposase